MKPTGYRSPYVKKTKAGNISTIRIVIAIFLCGVLVWILYKGKIETFLKTHLPGNDVKTPAPVKKTSSGVPPLIMDLDNIKFNVDAVETFADSKDQAQESSMILDYSQSDTSEIGMGKNSRLQLSFGKTPDSFNINLYQDNVNVLSGQLPVILADDLPGDGEYLGVCEARFSTGSGFKGTAFYKFRIKADFPSEISISASEINPGELIVMTLKNLNPDEKLEIETDLDYKPKVFAYGRQHIVMLPVSYYNKYGKVYQVKVRMGDETCSYAIKLNNKEFITQNLKIDEKIAAETRNEKSAKEVEDKVDPLRPVADPEPYWTGKFIMPVEGGRVKETDFGKHRTVNGSKSSYRHNGLDIGHDKGTPVMASNNGRVLLAEYLIGTGNTVIIEHGFGLKTWYYHMDELSVKTGDWVKQGDIIGKVGSTGFSTSPHLHFSASVNEVYINPITLINEGVPLFTPD